MSLQPVLDSIPFVAKVGIRCDAFAPGKIALSLPDNKGNHNHAAGLHAGALFTLAETAGSAAAGAGVASGAGVVTSELPPQARMAATSVRTTGKRRFM